MVTECDRNEYCFIDKSYRTLSYDRITFMRSNVSSNIVILSRAAIVSTELD